MNLLIITLSLSEKNGIGRYSVGVINALSKYLDRIEALVPKEDVPSSLLSKKCNVHQILPSMGRLGIPLVLCYSAISIQKFIRKADIVHSFMDYPYAVLSALGTSITKKPLIITCHGTYSVEPMEYLVSGKLLRFAFKKANRVLCVSKFTQNEILKRVRLKNTMVIPNGFHFNRLQKIDKMARDTSKRIILGVGAIKPRKGFDISLQAFARVKEDVPDIEYHIAGDISSKAFYDTLTKMISRLGISNDVHFLGEAGDDELDKLYQTADVFILTPRNINNNFEGFGLVYLEAGARGKPVVASDSGGVPDAVLDGVTGLVVPENDVEATAKALKRVLTDEKLAEQLGANGRKRAKELSWDNIVKKIIEVYEEVLREERNF